MDKPERTGGKQGNGRFKKGVSGNPGGRPPGSRNKASLLAQALLEGQSEKLVQKAIELALEGNVPALRTLIERLLPPKREQSISLDLPPITSPEDAKNAMATIFAALARGDLLPTEASQLAEMVDTYVATSEASDLARRLTEVEEQLRRNK
jgi:hypothetical protein